jgi:hypothetical protein
VTDTRLLQPFTDARATPSCRVKTPRARDQPGGWDYVALAIGLFGFLAVAAAADVLARAVVSAAEKKAEAELDARSHFIRVQRAALGP